MSNEQPDDDRWGPPPEEQESKEKPEKPEERGALVKRQGFNELETRSAAETSAHALAARAKAEVESRFIVALRRPRDMDDVRLRVLAECKRHGFAERARYGLPRWDSKQRKEVLVTGWSIRFAESVARNFGNLDRQAVTVYEDDERRVVRVTVLDLETNYAESRDVVVQKRVERHKLRQGQKALASRTNADGDKIYIVAATDQEILEKTNAMVSKAARSAILAMVPADVLDDAADVVKKTLETQDAKDPSAARKRIVEAFGGVGVSAQQLKDFLGQDLDALNDEARQLLRGLFAAIRDGETTWRDLVADQGQAPTEEAAAATKAPARGMARLREQAAKAKGSTGGATAPTETTPGPQKSPGDAPDPT